MRNFVSFCAHLFYRSILHKFLKGFMYLAVIQPIAVYAQSMAKGQWLYVDVPPGGAKLGWADPDGEHFEGVRFECSSGRMAVFLFVDVDAKKGVEVKASISRGSESFLIRGTGQEGPSSSTISKLFSINEFIAFAKTSGNIVINTPNGSTSYGSEKLGNLLAKFINKCEIGSVPNNQQVVAASSAPSSERDSIFVKACTKDGSDNAKSCSCAEALMRRKFGPRGYAVVELAIQGKMEEAKTAYQRMSFQEQFNYGSGVSLAANAANAACGTHMKM